MVRRRTTKSKPIHAAPKQSNIIAMTADVELLAAETDEAGNAKPGPRKFNVVAYTGGAMMVGGYDLPVVVDLDGMAFGKSLIANLDHDSSKRVGHVTEKSKDGGKLTLGGIASAATPARAEVIDSAAEGFVWQASIEARPDRLIEVAAGKTIKANGREFTGPLYLAKKSTLKGFAFVSHGADDNTSATIAATADSPKGQKMKAEVKAWAESMGIDVDNASDELLATIEANYAGRQPPKPTKRLKLEDGLLAKEAEFARVDGITEIALAACDKRPYDIAAIKALAEQAIEGKWSIEKFRLELLEASLPPAHTVFRTKRDERMNSSVIEAAICMAGRLPGHEDQFSEQTLEAAHKQFRDGIGLRQLFLLCAEANGYHNRHGSNVNLDVQRAAFGMTPDGRRSINAAGFSTVDISTILSNTANKFLRDGWNAVDQTPLRVAAIRPVNDFKTITTVSLTGVAQFEKVGNAGEIPHGTLGEVTYSNKADTYARMLAITRQDIINDDLGALTMVPRKLGRGAMLMLNHIFWTEFLDNSTFFASGNSNINEGVADITIGGLDATETIFMNQTDPNGKPLGIMPSILLVPTALKNKSLALMDPQGKVTSGATGGLIDSNVFAGRFVVESSPYMSNTSYTGYSAAAWYMLASPNDLPVIEIAALNGRVEPTVETADADFNVLGVQMRGYSDVGVNLQEYRGGVRADGGSS